MAETKKRKKKKKSNLVYAVIIMILSLALAGLLVFVALGGSFYKPKVDGDYIRKIDVTAEAVTKATLWLNDVQGANITAEEIRDYIGKVYVEADVIFKGTGSTYGNYSQTINEESYRAAEDMVYEAVGKRLNELMVDRLIKAGYEPELETTTIEDTVKEAMGMSTSEYLLKADIGLLPLLTDMQSEYNLKGGYTYEDNTLTIKAGDSETVGLAVLSNEAMMFDDVTYIRRENVDEN